jgi:hypothetical protein
MCNISLTLYLACECMFMYTAKRNVILYVLMCVCVMCVGRKEIYV